MVGTTRARTARKSTAGARAALPTETPAPPEAVQVVAPTIVQTSNLTQETNSTPAVISTPQEQPSQEVPAALPQTTTPSAPIAPAAPPSAAKDTAKTAETSDMPPAKKVKTVATFVKRTPIVSGDGTKVEPASVSKLSPAERLALRTSKFKTTVSDNAKLTLRAQKFGGILPEAKKTFGPVAAAVDSEILKKRAERFGTVPTNISTGTDSNARLQARKERFANVAKI